MKYQNLSLEQIDIDRNVQSMPVWAIYYWDCETKPIVSNGRYRYASLKPIVWDDRYQKTYHYSMFAYDRYRYVDLSPFYCFSVAEQRRSNTARLSTMNSNSPFFIHAARPSSPSEDP